MKTDLAFLYKSKNWLFKFFLITVSLLIINVLFLSAEPTEDVLVEFILISSSHCRPCQIFKEKTLPKILEKYRGKIKIKELDMNKPNDYLKILQLQDKYSFFPKNIRTPTIFIDGKLLIGTEDIKRYLEIYIDTALSKSSYAHAFGAQAYTDLVSKFKFITPLGVITAGLIDGINPCAFTAIIFFISFLTLQGYNKSKILTIGLSFILAVFITYVLVGLSLFNFLFKLKAYWIVGKILYIAGALLCFTLAGLAFYDFVKFHSVAQAQNLVLQLPRGLKDRIRWIIELFYRKEKQKEKHDYILRLIVSAFIVGTFVSIFEAVCTGQVYLPTIVFVLKTTPLRIKAFSYLLLYNLMFIVPLWLILLLALWGVTSWQFSNFTQRHMGTIKILMALLFLGLGFFLICQ